ncbi:MAG TPA: phosphoenolpyruvate-utilizing N-terminal domain-containing protein, partial [Burkholderiales bacterium]
MKPAENSSAVGASFTLHGAGVSGGIAIGRAHLVSTARLEVAHYEVAPQEIEAELERFDRAIAQVQGELAALQAGIPAGAPAEMKAILSLHAMLLNDANLSTVPRN